MWKRVHVFTWSTKHHGKMPRVHVSLQLLLLDPFQSEQSAASLQPCQQIHLPLPPASSTSRMSFHAHCSTRAPTRLARRALPSGRDTGQGEVQLRGASETRPTGAEAKPGRPTGEDAKTGGRGVLLCNAWCWSMCQVERGRCWRLWRSAKQLV